MWPTPTGPPLQRFQALSRQSYSLHNRKQALGDLCAQAKQKAIDQGADPATLRGLSMSKSSLILIFLIEMARVIVRYCGKRIKDHGFPFCDLAKKKCIPCKGGVPPLKGAPLSELYLQLAPGWKVVDEHHLEKSIYSAILKRPSPLQTKLAQLPNKKGTTPTSFSPTGRLKSSSGHTRSTA